MSDNDAILPDEDPEAGEPVRELALLREAPDSRFVDRIHGSVHRRIFAAQSVDFSIMALFQAFMDYLGLLLSSLLGAPPEKEKK